MIFYKAQIKYRLSETKPRHLSPKPCGFHLILWPASNLGWSLWFNHCEPWFPHLWNSDSKGIGLDKPSCSSSSIIFSPVQEMSRVNQQTLCGLQNLWAIFLKVSVDGNIRKGGNLRCGWWGSLKSKGLLKKQELDARWEKAEKTLWGCWEVKVSYQQWGTNMAEVTIISQRWCLTLGPHPGTPACLRSQLGYFTALWDREHLFTQY